MGTARQDFERFIRWLHDPGRVAPEGACRFANLVLANFDAVAGAARQHHNRSHLLARLARDYLAGMDADLPLLQEVAPQGQWPWVRLRHLTLGPFRGFREEQEFDLSKRVVLCYGPNGSGKSSLCEALEYALRGSVEEAGSRRLAIRDYLANLHAGRFEEPVLTATNSDGQEVAVRADEDAYRFLFIEKNRIDNFSRIAASPPGRKNDLIATLFGMDQFNGFASHFNESMEAALTLGTQTQTLLTVRRQALSSDEAAVANEAGLLAATDQAAAEYATAFAKQLTYEELQGLIGSELNPSRLQELEARQRALPPAIIGTSRALLAEHYERARASADGVAAGSRALQERQEQISFRDLFAAVQALRANDPDHCPACLTDIAETAQDPFLRAEKGLESLAALAALEAEHEMLVRSSEEAHRALGTELGKLAQFLESLGEQNSTIFAYLSKLAHHPEMPDLSAVIGAIAAERPNGACSLEELFEVADRIAAHDSAACEVLAARETEAAELRSLNDARVWMASHETRRERVVQDAVQARERISQWEDVNAHLIQQAAREAEANGRDGPIEVAYGQFLGMLAEFRAQLPGMLMADLNTTTMELYNEFNYGDRDEDKLADLRLPLTGEDAIEVAFRGDPARRVNALSTLSEGHIRCLGLAILLAKANSVMTPLIIFDDAINAIDHDHRGGIRAAIFETDRFRDVQIIVTCHSPEFVKDIENNLPRERRGDCKEYVLRHHDGNHQPRVNPDVGSSNYLFRARQAMDRFDPRDALSYARKALEMFTHKAWRWLESHRSGNIAVQLEGPRKEPQLRVLCEALRSKLAGTPVFVHASKQPLLDNLNSILGIPEQTLVWKLLNAGTHEEPDRDDFDLQHVETVLRVLENIDNLELRPDR